MKSTEENMILWQQLIAERNKSGKTVAQWCADNNISKHKYYYWNNKINKRQSDADEVNFAEITHTNAVSDNIVLDNIKYQDFKILYKDIQLIIPNKFNSNSLAELINVLHKL